MIRVDQLIEAQSLPDPGCGHAHGAGRVARRELNQDGMTVAVCAGSRGIANYDVIVRAVCQELKRLGAEVSLCPWASHGGGTDAGQLEVLAHYGITPETMGVPIRSSMEVVELGRAASSWSIRTAMRREPMRSCSWQPDKPHTDFHGPLESGLMKMAVVGLGKQKGAAQFHQATVRLGHAQALLMAGPEVLQRSRIAFGVGILENPLHQTARIAAVPAR